jgi:hypothetical protein
MNSKKVRVPLGDRTVEGEEIAFKEIEERWNEYDLEDGTKLKIKLVLAKVIRTNEYNKEGDPIYVVNTQNLLHVTVPEKFKKKVS